MTSKGGHNPIYSPILNLIVFDKDFGLKSIWGIEITLGPQENSCWRNWWAEKHADLCWFVVLVIVTKNKEDAQGWNLLYCLDY